MLRSAEYPDILNPFAGEENESVEIDEVNEQFRNENGEEKRENIETSIDYDEAKNPFYKGIQQDMMTCAQNNISSGICLSR